MRNVNTKLFKVCMCVWCRVRIYSKRFIFIDGARTKLIDGYRQTFILLLKRNIISLIAYDIYLPFIYAPSFGFMHYSVSISHSLIESHAYLLSIWQN